MVENSITPSSGYNYECVTRRVEVANRLPEKLITGTDGTIRTERTIGGMASAIKQAIEKMSGNNGCSSKVVFIGWADPPRDRVDIREENLNLLFENTAGIYRMVPVWLTDKEVNDYYGLIANRNIWPYQHGHEKRADYSPDKFPRAWETFVGANTKFAERILAEINDQSQLTDCQLRIHDYHLPLVGQILKERGFKGKITSFQHIPFGRPKNYLTMPHAQEILHGMLHFDFIGFQTVEDRDNFVASVRHLYPNTKITVTKDHHLQVETGGNKVKVGAIPISIDIEEFKKIAAKEEVIQMAKDLRTAHNRRKIVFLAGRSDYKNGFVESLMAYYIALSNNSDIHDRITYLLSAPASRDAVPAYKKYSCQISKWIDQINRKFGNESWKPVVFYEKGLNTEEMVAHYIAADAILIGSRKDGQNLVAKEGVAVARNDCIMIISTGAGVAKEFRDALLFDPKHIREQAELIPQVLMMSYGKRQKRMQELKIALKRNQIDDWERNFWEAAYS